VYVFPKILVPSSLLASSAPLPVIRSGIIATLRFRSSGYFPNAVAKTNCHLTQGNLAVIVPSLYIQRLLSSALPIRSLPPRLRCCCATMAQAAIFTNGSKPSASDSVRASPAASTPTAGTKRKRTSDQKFYAVREGKKPGIYSTWEECLSQVTGHKGASCMFSRATWNCRRRGTS
jgi:hypothetical protein